MTRPVGLDRPGAQRSSAGSLLAAAAFGALVLLAPLGAFLFGDVLNAGGLTGLVALVLLTAVLLVLSLGCLGLFLRGHASAMIGPDHAALDRHPPDQQALMLAFGFDGHDLLANRDGRLSARQRANLHAGMRMMLVMAAVMLAVTYVGFATVTLLPAGSGESAPLFSGDTRGLWIGLALVNVLIGASLLYGYWLMRDRVHLRLSVAEGSAGPRSHEGDGHAASAAVPSVRIGSVAVPVTDRARAAALTEGRRYRVYFVRAPIALVLSIEPL